MEGTRPGSSHYQSPEEYTDRRIADLVVRLDERFAAQKEAIGKAEAHATAILEAHNGLIRQMQERDVEYARENDLSQLRSALDVIRVDHVPRAEFTKVEGEVNAAAGRRVLIAGLGGLLAATAALAFGYLLSAQPSHEQISAQIQAEAPWVADRPQVEARLAALERKDVTQQADIDALQVQVRFFCAARTKAGLPGC